MKKIQSKVFQLVFVLSAMTAASVSMADVSVVVNPSSPVSSLSDKDLKRVYLGKATTLPGGVSVTLSDQTFGSDVRAQFYRMCCNVSAQQARSRWAGILFSGSGQPPAEVGADKEVVSWVAGNKNAMGYVDSTMVDSTVKVIKVLK
ncbi:MAG: phosphate ABC transporter substrate-binding protein [Gammaproteobacteria bacterium]|nr:phosphate ABC transporter substrate-binding protein [Gammaproteobacteria bacterium]